MSAPDQLAIQLPDVDIESLIEQVRTMRSQLIQHKQALLQSVADNKLDGSDALITAIMPGGLLYAGYKKARHAQAKKELDRVSADIEEISDDLLAMQSRSAPVVMAQLP
jgi:pyruvate/oxaloacetate carboxyltransferase